MRLFKILIVSAALLDAAMFLTSAVSPLNASSPAQSIGLSGDNVEVAASLNQR